jgi:hypothetical protein
LHGWRCVVAAIASTGALAVVGSAEWPDRG